MTAAHHLRPHRSSRGAAVSAAADGSGAQRPCAGEVILIKN